MRRDPAFPCPGPLNAVSFFYLLPTAIEIASGDFSNWSATFSFGAGSRAAGGLQAFVVAAGRRGSFPRLESLETSRLSAPAPRQAYKASCWPVTQASLSAVSPLVRPASVVRAKVLGIKKPLHDGSTQSGLVRAWRPGARPVSLVKGFLVPLRASRCMASFLSPTAIGIPSRDSSSSSPPVLVRRWSWAAGAPRDLVVVAGRGGSFPPLVLVRPRTKTAHPPRRSQGSPCWPGAQASLSALAALVHTSSLFTRRLSASRNYPRRFDAVLAFPGLEARARTRLACGCFLVPLRASRPVNISGLYFIKAKPPPSLSLWAGRQACTVLIKHL